MTLEELNGPMVDYAMQQYQEVLKDPEHAMQQYEKMLKDPKHAMQQYQKLLKDPSFKRAMKPYQKVLDDPKLDHAIEQYQEQYKCQMKLKDALKLPSDAKSLDKKESDQMLEDLQGEWEVVPEADSKQTICPGAKMSSTVYERVFVNHDVLTLSGGKTKDGSPVKPQAQQIAFSRSGNKTLYIDKLGTVVTNFEPEKGVVSFKNAFGIELKWQRKLSEKSTVTEAAEDSSTKAKTDDTAKSSGKSGSKVKITKVTLDDVEDTKVLVQKQGLAAGSVLSPMGVGLAFD